MWTGVWPPYMLLCWPAYAILLRYHFRALGKKSFGCVHSHTTAFSSPNAPRLTMCSVQDHSRALRRILVLFPTFQHPLVTFMVNHPVRWGVRTMQGHYVCWFIVTECVRPCQDQHNQAYIGCPKEAHLPYAQPWACGLTCCGRSLLTWMDSLEMAIDEKRRHFEYQST